MSGTRCSAQTADFVSFKATVPSADSFFFEFVKYHIDESLKRE
jgi:hypothetical protein